MAVRKTKKGLALKRWFKEDWRTPSGEKDYSKGENTFRPTKKISKYTPKTWSQLSAGEKALTAIALLFSIYQVKPSPYCILDEVDAPLDDVNIRKFTRVLNNFSNETQFIVVTHNKLTMESANFLYGVTMEKKGVSQLVSVKLD